MFFARRTELTREPSAASDDLAPAAVGGREHSGSAASGTMFGAAEEQRSPEQNGHRVSEINGSLLYNYEQQLAVRPLGCCTSRHKLVSKARAPPVEGPVWETAGMTWWDFQRRRLSTLWTMKSMYRRIQQCEADCAKLPAGPEQDELWRECHRQNAVGMREHAEEAKGLFIKAGQFLSSLVGALPDEYSRELISLTDHLPISTLEEVFRTIQKDVHRPPKEVFSSFDPLPIASASIAQVHKAKLRGKDGQVVAVKVQHEGVDRVLLEDVRTLSTVAGRVAYWAPDIDFRKAVEEMAESLPAELDFREERRAVDRAGRVIRKAGNRTIVPRVDKKLFGRHMFVMEFIESEPIMQLANKEFCTQHGLDKHAILGTLLDAFGIMAFKDGMFHADPHPGNVRLSLNKEMPGGAAPVLLDWGHFKEMNDEERLGLCKVFHALANFDIYGLFNVLDGLGCSFRPEMMTDEFRRELLEKARSAMKDTVNRETARANVMYEYNEYQEKVKSGKEGAAKKSVNPMYFLEDWPNCILAFMRMLSILRGLCVAADAEGMPVLQVFARHAREALVESSSGRVSSVITPLLRSLTGANSERAPPLGDNLSARGEKPPLGRALEARIRAKLEDLLARQRIVGAQVAVVQGGRLVCDAAAGTLSSIDARQVKSGTCFPLMGAAAGLGAVAALRALKRIAGELTMPVADFWPQFGGGNSRVTLSDLLGHRAGLQEAYPMPFRPMALDDYAGLVGHLESVSLPESQATRFAYLLQAFALARLGDGLAGEDNLLHWLGSELGPLGLDVAAPNGNGEEATICRDLPELARVSMSEVRQGRARRKEQDQRESAPDFVAAAPKEQGVAASNLLDALAGEPLTFDPLQANSWQGGMFRAGLSLGASARGLATALSAEVLWRELTELGALEAGGSDPTALGWLLTGGACKWTAGGLQVLQLQGCGANALWSRSRSGFGIVCGFGPSVAHFPDLAPGGVTIAVMVNDVLRGREVAAELMAEGLADYGYAPTWPAVPVSVLADAARLLQSEQAGLLLQTVGGLRGLQRGLRGQSSSKAGSRCGGLSACVCQPGRAERNDRPGWLPALGARCCGGNGG